MYHTLYRASVLLKQFYDEGYTGCFSIAFLALFVHALSLKMLSIKQGSSTYHFRSLWYDLVGV